MAKTERIMKGGRELWPTINGGVGLKYLIYFNETEANELPPRLPKELADVISQPQPIIFGNSWRIVEVTEERRVPQLQEGGKEDLGNYPSVSLASIPGKVSEQIVQASVLGY